MKILAKLLVIAAVTLAIPLSSAEAKRDTAPGQNKPLAISNVSVVTSPTTVTISWTTSGPAQGSVIIFDEFEGLGYIDTKSGTQHQVTVRGLHPGTHYGFQIESHTATQTAVTEEDSFQTPN